MNPLAPPQPQLLNWGQVHRQRPPTIARGHRIVSCYCTRPETTHITRVCGNFQSRSSRRPVTGHGSTDHGLFQLTAVQAKLTALGSDLKGVAEKTELIMLLEQPLGQKTAGKCLKALAFKVCGTNVIGCCSAKVLLFSNLTLLMFGKVYAVVRSFFRSNSTFTRLQPPSESVPPFELWVPVCCFLADMASKTESQAPALRISSAFKHGAWPKQLCLYRIFDWHFVLHLSDRDWWMELDVLVSFCGYWRSSKQPEPRQNVQISVGASYVVCFALAHFQPQSPRFQCATAGELAPSGNDRKKSKLGCALLFHMFYRFLSFSKFSVFFFMLLLL